MALYPIRCDYQRNRDYVNEVLTSVRAKIRPNPNFIRQCRKYWNP